MTAPALAIEGVSKSFGGRRVLIDVSLRIERGEIHALLGQNGSGKSTLIRILSGYHAPDHGGVMSIGGRPLALPLAPTTARKLGLAFVHQDLGLAERLTVLENLRVGRYETGRPWRIRWRSERRLTAALLAEFGLHWPPDTPLSDLPEVDRAMLAIVRAVQDLRASGVTGVLVLDEPTAYLPHDSAERLFVVIRRAAASGVGVLLVTHRLREALDLAHTISVLRDGKLVGSESAPSLTEADLIQRVIGFSLGELYPAPHEPTGELVLAVDGLSGDGVNDVSFDLRRGEVVGLTGLVGMGWERIPYLLFGAATATSGRVFLQGRWRDASEFSVRRAVGQSLALLPANRGRDGGFALATVLENLTLPTLAKYYRSGILRHRTERRHTRETLTEFDVRPRTPHARFGTLSGGNQQKVLLAKWFETNPTVFLMHEPTQGVDVGARQRIFRQIGDSAQRGKAFLLASADYEDLAHLCDRVLVFYAGRVQAQVGRAGLTAERLVELAFGGEHHAAPETAVQDRAEWRRGMGDEET